MINIAEVSIGNAFPSFCFTDFSLAAVFDNVMNDHFMLLIETCMTAGKILLMAWHDDTMSESMDDAERPEKALEDFLVVIFTTWTTLVNALNDIYAVPAKATVSNESCKGKRELIGNTVTIIAEHVKFAVLEAERDTLSRECYITMAAKEIGKLSRNGAEKRGGSYMESDVTS